MLYSKLSLLPKSENCEVGTFCSKPFNYSIAVISSGKEKQTVGKISLKVCHVPQRFKSNETSRDENVSD